MGRAIDVDNKIDKLEAEMKTLKTAFEGLASTVDSLKDTAPTRKNVDLHKKSDERNIKAEGVKTKKDKKPELVTEET
jgi:archaellum component FlaC